jgi:putative ABC transport system permease protein
MSTARSARWLVGAIAWLVPGDVRAEWHRDWDAELSWCAGTGRGTWHQLRRARGAWRHAFWLRTHRWRTDMLLQDLRHSVRALRARPALTAVAVLTLALGIGANTAIFSVVHAVLLRRLPYPDADQLVSIYATHRKYNFDHGVETPADIQYWMDHAQSTSGIAPMSGGSTTVTTGGEPDRLRYSAVTPAFFDVMRVAPLMGRVFTAAESAAEEHVVVVSHELWRSRLNGASDFSAMTLELDGQPWRVIGVMPAEFKYPAGIAMWRPFDFSRAMQAWHLGSVARLKPGVTVAAAQHDFDRMAMALEAASPKARKDRGFNVAGLRQDLAYRALDGVKLLQGVVALVLLIACVNVANLMLAQAGGRRHEFGVRAAIGASRARLVRQLVTESVVLSMIGAAIGATIAVPGVRALVAAAPPFLLSYPDDIGVNWIVLAYTAAIAAVTGLIFGLAPAVMLSQPGLAGAVGHGQRTAAAGLSLSRRQYFRGALVAVEIALALVLLVGGGLLIRSFTLLARQAPGFNTDNLLTAQIALPAAAYPTDEARHRFWSSLTERLAATPGISHAVVSNALPFSDWEWQTDFKVEGREDVPNNGVGIRHVSAGYFEALGIPVQRGRGVADEDRGGAPAVAFVSDAFVRQHMPGMDPIGHRIRLGRTEPWLTVAGVVASTRHLNLAEDLRPEIYVPTLQGDGPAMMQVAVRTRVSPSTLAEAMRSAVHSLDPKLPVQRIKTMTELISANVAERRFLMTLLALFAGLAAALAAIGVYSVMSFIVSQGRREIGIRLALGARPSQVQRRLVGQGLRVVVIGAIVGLGASLLLTRLLKSQLFETQPNDPLTIVTMTALVVAAAALACWIPARRTSRVDPTESLRQA